MAPHRWLASLIQICSLTTPTSAGAKIPFVLEYGREKIVKVADFPDWTYFQTTDQQYFDVGVLYKQVRIFLIPLWNYEIRWCGYLSDEQYVPLTPLEVRNYARTAGVELPVSPPLPPWDEWGGKLVRLVVVGGAALGVWSIVQDTKEPSA